MAISSRCQFYHLFLCASLLLFSTSSSHQSNISWSPSEDDHVALFVFGDSYFDAGNNNYLKNALGRSNYWPYGETFFNYPTGRFSDGRLIPDFIAEFLKLPLIRPYLEPGNHQLTDGVNFASAGAGALVETYAGLVIDLRTPASYFKNVEKQVRQQLGNAVTNTLLSRAIYLVSVGSNDYLAPFASNSTTFLHSYSHQEYVAMVIGNLTTVIKGIYESGGRKFGILELGPLGCYSFTKALNYQNKIGRWIEEATVLAKLHNRALSQVLEELKTQLKDFEYAYFDFFSSLTERMSNPSEYGFKEGKMACCGAGPARGTFLRCGGKDEYKLCEDPSKNLFFDSGHLSEKAYNQFSEQMWSAGPNVTSPYNLRTLAEKAQGAKFV